MIGAFSGSSSTAWVSLLFTYPTGTFPGNTTLLDFLSHAFFNFLGQFINVVLCQHDLNAMNQFGMGFGILLKNFSFFNQMDFEIKIFQGYVIPRIQVEPVGFFN